MGAVKETLRCNDLERSYRPPTGLAAAKIEVRAFKVALTPACKSAVTIRFSLIQLSNIDCSATILRSTNLNRTTRYIHCIILCKEVYTCREQFWYFISLI